MNLTDTVAWMSSSDYHDRFLAEYWQTKMRYDRLYDMVVRYEAGTLDFKPDCPLDLLKEQQAAMGQYLYCLEVRAHIEHMTLQPTPAAVEASKAKAGEENAQAYWDYGICSKCGYVFRGGDNLRVCANCGTSMAIGRSTI